MNFEDSTICEKKAIIELLQLYKDFPCLWDTSDNLYCNKDARNQAMEVLVEKWKLCYPNSTTNDVKKKIEHLRAAYRRERNKVESSRTSGAGMEDVHTPSLWYYEYLTFLHEKATPTTKIIDNLETSSSQSNIEEPATKREKTLKKQQNALLKKQSDLIESTKLLISGEETSADAFGHSVSSQLKELPKVQRCIAEKIIGEILFYAKLGELTFETSINLNKHLHSNQYYSHSQPSPYQSSPHHSQPSRYQPSPSPQHSQPSPYQPSPSPQHSQPSPYQPLPSPQHSQPSPYQQSPSPQHSQPLPYQPSPSPQHSQPSPDQQSPSPQHSQPSPYQPSSSPQHSQPSPYQPSPQYSQPSPYQQIASPQRPSPSSQLTSHHPFQPPADSQQIYLVDLPPIQLDSASLLNDFPNISASASSDLSEFTVVSRSNRQEEVFRGKGKELKKYLIFKK